ncbi:hypothetical protein [Lacticaseibacillus parakribbianus]|uniref:hypothetical protein n=1 Tax=Lacticaseibacillus parakribbianus TaxID=2970927 RepID=UPI0021CB78EF|nr:hypothetical protein [Lacticaseibacillus parakribbianus]
MIKSSHAKAIALVILTVLSFVAYLSVGQPQVVKAANNYQLNPTTQEKVDALIEQYPETEAMIESSMALWRSNARVTPEEYNTAVLDAVVKYTSLVEHSISQYEANQSSSDSQGGPKSDIYNQDITIWGAGALAADALDWSLASH